MNEDLMHFIIGSSPLITIYPMIYLYYAKNQISLEQQNQLAISFSTMCFIYPIASGILFAAIYYFAEYIPRKWGDTVYIRFGITGAISSTILGIAIDRILHSNEDVKIENWLAIFIFYLFIYFVIGTWMRIQVIYGSTAEFLRCARKTMEEDRKPITNSGMRLNAMVPNITIPSSLTTPAVRTEMPMDPNSSFVFDQIKSKV